MDKVNTRKIILTYGFSISRTDIEKYLIEFNHLEAPLKNMSYTDRFSKIKEVLEWFNLTAYDCNSDHIIVAHKEYQEFKLPEAGFTFDNINLRKITPSVKDYTRLVCIQHRINLELEKLTASDKVILDCYTNNISTIMISVPY